MPAGASFFTDLDRPLKKNGAGHLESAFCTVKFNIRVAVGVDVIAYYDCDYSSRMEFKHARLVRIFYYRVDAGNGIGPSFAGFGKFCRYSGNAFYGAQSIY